MTTYRKLRFDVCLTCQEPVVIGTVAGVKVSLARKTIPVADGVVLARYWPGSVFTITRHHNGDLWADFFDPDTSRGWISPVHSHRTIYEDWSGSD